MVRPMVSRASMVGRALVMHLKHLPVAYLSSLALPGTRSTAAQSKTISASEYPGARSFPSRC